MEKAPVVQQKLTVSDKHILLAKQIYHVNQLKPYPLSKTEIEDWAISINELRPEITAQHLKTIIDNFKIGHFIWDNTLGIQNLLNPKHKAISEGMLGSYTNPLG